MKEPEKHVFHLREGIVEMRDRGSSLVFELLPQQGERSSFMTVSRILPGVNAAFYEYASSRCHAFNDMSIARAIVGSAPDPRSMLEVNACREGSLRVLFPKEGVVTVLRQGDLSLAVTSVSDRLRIPAAHLEEDWMVDLPTGQYRGFGLIIDLERVGSEAAWLADALGVNIQGICGAYRLHEQEFVMVADAGTDRVLDSLEQRRRLGDESLLKIGVIELLAQLKERAASAQRAMRPKHSIEAVALVREARNRAAANLRERSTIECVARSCGMSPTTFKAVFRHLYGEPFARHLFRLRMDRAEELLAKGGTVIEAAEAVGYESASKFTAAFKRTFGETPSSYRRKMIGRLRDED